MGGWVVFRQESFVFQKPVKLLLDGAEGWVFRVARAGKFDIHDFGNVAPGG